MVTMRNRRFAVTLLLGGMVGLVLGLLVYQTWLGKSSEPPPNVPGFLWPNPKPVGPFTLADQNQQPFGLERLKDKWTFLFFGYTHCPDVCPLTLSVLSDVKERLQQSPQGTQDVQVVFVSLDPQRDTPEQIGRYVQYFEEDFVGVTGDEETLSELTRQLGIVYRKTEPGPRGDYLVDHTASILLTDPQARLVGVFGAPHKAQVIAERFSAIRGYLEG
jgi:protein SCO1/2